MQLKDALIREGEQKEQLYAYIARAERRWSEEEEERFQGEITRFKRDIEPAGKKSLRVLYRMFGVAALDWAASLGAIPVAASLIARYVAERAAGRP